MQKLLTISCLLFAAVFLVAEAHLCMLSPPQRGSIMNINKPASPDCGLVTGPCGGRGKGESFIGIRAGSKFLVAFQKNLDHFNKDSPGSFNVSVSFDNEKTFKDIEMMPDTADPSLTLYYKNVTMPTGPVNQPGILRVIYETKNPEAPPMFYQCSDFMMYVM
ncbi:uncharacterized protein [Diadema setosum]|uniref:uncharacterized protein n=1 Tax=Diadema setosum TaxID=31175 RepID=UPI003B3A038A